MTRSFGTGEGGGGGGVRRPAGLLAESRCGAMAEGWEWVVEVRDGE